MVEFISAEKVFLEYLTVASWLQHHFRMVGAASSISNLLGFEVFSHDTLVKHTCSWGQPREQTGWLEMWVTMGRKDHC